MNKIFDSLKDSALVIKELFQEDTSIVIEDKNKILFISDGKFNKKYRK